MPKTKELINGLPDLVAAKVVLDKLHRLIDREERYRARLKKSNPDRYTHEWAAVSIIQRSLKNFLSQNQD